MIPQSDPLFGFPPPPLALPQAVESTSRPSLLNGDLELRGGSLKLDLKPGPAFTAAWLRQLIAPPRNLATRGVPGELVKRAPPVSAPPRQYQEIDPTSVIGDVINIALDVNLLGEPR